MVSKNLMTVRQFVESCAGAWPASEGTVRALILDAKRGENNFQSAFLRIGRRVLVNPENFWRCVHGMKGFKK